MNSREIAHESRKNIILSKAMEMSTSGWPQSVDSVELKPYFQTRHELLVEQSCLLFGSKAIVPKNSRAYVSKLFHEQHIEILRTKI